MEIKNDGISSTTRQKQQKFTSRYDILKNMHESILECLKKEVAGKRARVADLSEKILQMKIELSAFEAEYHKAVGALFLKLDEVELGIKEYTERIVLVKRRKMKDMDELDRIVSRHFKKERERIHEQQEEAGEFEKEYRAIRNKPVLSEPSAKRLKTLYRDLSKKYHPDMAGTPDAVTRFHFIMAEINRAYEEKDLADMELIAQRLTREEEMKADAGTVGEQLEKLRQESGQLDSIVSNLRADLLMLLGSNTYALKKRVNEATAKGKDLLRDMARTLNEKIRRKQKELASLKQECERIADAI